MVLPYPLYDYNIWIYRCVYVYVNCISFFYLSTYLSVLIQFFFLFSLSLHLLSFVHTSVSPSPYSTLRVSLDLDPFPDVWAVFLSEFFFFSFFPTPLCILYRVEPCRTCFLFFYFTYTGKAFGETFCQNEKSRKMRQYTLSKCEYTIVQASAIKTRISFSDRT